MFTATRHLRHIAGLVTAAALTAVAVAGPAQAAPPPATALEKVSSVVQPGIVYLQTTYAGVVRDRQGNDIAVLDEQGQPVTVHTSSSRCTGFAVNPDGYIGTAGHCVDLDLGAESIIDTVAQQLWEQNPELQSVAVEDLKEAARTQWTVVTPHAPHHPRPARDVTAAYGAAVSGLPTGRALPARVLGSRDMANGDVALVKIEAEGLPALELAPDARVEVGTEVVSVGYPGSVDLVADQTFDASYKDGAVSSKKTIRDGLRGVFEISAAVSPGMSGGPTVDLDGRVVGVNSFGIVGEPQPFNFISPASEMAQLLRDEGVRNEIGSTNEIYRAGLAAYYAGDREGAIARFDRVLVLEPSHELAQRFRVKAQELAPAARAPEPQDGGLSAALLALMTAAAVALCALAVVTVRIRRGRPPFAGTRSAPEPDGPRDDASFADASTPALRVQDGPLAGRRFPVGSQLILGRENADVAIDDPQISRRHAIVRRVERGLEIEDLGSANGTTVNGAPIVGPYRLRDGDLIEVGRMRLAAEVPAPRAQETVVRGIMRDAVLVVRDGALEGRRYPVAAEFVIGRQDADLMLDDAQVSRRHAIVRTVPGGLEIEDLHSANGTWINGSRLDGRRRLQHGDVIGIGPVTLEALLGMPLVVHPAADPQATVHANGNGR